MLNNQAAVIGGDMSGIHQMRVATRRLRSALKLFRPVIASPEAAWIEGELKWLGTELGRARDWDVLATNTLPAIANGVTGAVDAIVPAIRGQRRAAHKTAAQTILGARYTTVVLVFGLWVEEDRWHEALDPSARRRLIEPFVDLAGDILDHAMKKVGKRGRHISRADAQGRHQLRKALKGLRYATDFLGPLYPTKRTKHYKQVLSDLQDCLGQLNDYAAAVHLIGDVVDADQRRAPLAGRIRFLPPLQQAKTVLALGIS
jgi:CHAD domain-containing protein